MESKWRKVKLALKLNSCLYVPEKGEEQEESSQSSSSITFISPRNHQDSVPSRFSSSDSAAVSPPGDDCRATTPTPSSSGLRLSKSGSKTSKKTCAICLAGMKPGQGHAIFTAECSHSFHFQCITSNVKHGNQVCPVCRAKWKEVPFQNPASNLPNGGSRINPLDWPRDDGWMAVLRRPPRLDSSRQTNPYLQDLEPAVFDDDELLDQHNESAEGETVIRDAAGSNTIDPIKIKMFPEISAVPRATPHNNFAVLIHLKAPQSGRQNSFGNGAAVPPALQNTRASVDLVTVLDVSGSMGGTKLALLKRAMGFVIQNLGSSDRLSVIAFSSSARRVFPLRRMTETGRQEALQAVNTLTANGGTNIAEGLRKGSKVLVDRKSKNPVCSIILLSDGQDTYTIPSPNGGCSRTNYKLLLPDSTHRDGAAAFQIPVHAFGFGTDHDAASMHSISEISGGTFSFIEAEGVIQDAFAQCIGGLLSVVVQEVSVKISCVHPNLLISSIKAGSYRTSMMADARSGSVDIGDLYAEEERDFLVTVNIPADECSEETTLLKVQCAYKDPITKETFSLQNAGEVNIQRPAIVTQPEVSMEVDRQRNRLRAAEAMSEARRAAEDGDLANAVSLLDSCRRALSQTISAQASDKLCISLSAELKEMQERMANRRIYEASGRAYVLSGLSSHSFQRATARGDSTSSTSLVQSYQTPSMVDMVTRSQTFIVGNTHSQQRLRHAQSFPARPGPR